jgi:hypothetical protein
MLVLGQRVVMVVVLNLMVDGKGNDIVARYHFATIEEYVLIAVSLFSLV